MSIVIIVEEDHGARRRSCEALREGGFEVLAAESRDEAITLLEVVEAPAIGGVLLGATREGGLIAHLEGRFGADRLVIREHENLTAAVQALRSTSGPTDGIVVHRVYQQGAQTTRSREDVSMVLRYFLQHCNKLHHKQIQGFSEAALARLCDHDWPGGVREIRATVEVMVQAARGPQITLAHLPGKGQCGADFSSFKAPLGLTIDELSRAYALQTLELVNGNKSEAARILGVGTKTLYRWLGKWHTTAQEGEGEGEGEGEAPEACEEREGGEEGTA